MDVHGLALTTTSINPSNFRSLFPSFASSRRRIRNISFPRKSKFVVFASKDEPKLDQWDKMELKFGRMLGEDPNLTIAKIMGKKLYPEMTNLEIEKEFYKKGGKPLYSDVEEVPFDVSRNGQSSNSQNGLNLVRPVPKKGVKFESNKPLLSEVRKPSRPLGAAVDNAKGKIPNVILRKPTTYKEDDVDEKQSKLRMKPNLLLNMGKGQIKEKFSDIILLKKPKPVGLGSTPDKEQGPSTVTEATSDMTLINKPERTNRDSHLGQEEQFSGDDLKENSLEGVNFSAETVSMTNSNFDESMDDSAAGLQPLGQSDIRSGERSTLNEPSETMEDSNLNFSTQSALQGKPKRLDRYVKGTSEVLVKRPSTLSSTDAVLMNSESYGNAGDLENFLAISPIKESEDTDWTRVEDLVKSGGRAEVEIISCSTRGFVVSFGSLAGFLPYRNLAARWKFLAFESWLRRKGLDPSLYKQSLGVIGSFDATNKTASPENVQNVEGEISPEMQLDDLLRIYDQEKLKFLSSFVGQKIKVNVILADRKSRKLIFSVKPKQKEELVEKKRGLMARLGIGDVIKCSIRKITYFGIFVEVEGVPALIHQTEVSWDATLDPASYFKVGQIVDAKVHQLDFSSERIFLSLREITPDPLSEALEAVIGDHDSLDGTLEAAEADTEWPEVESLIKELQKFKGIQSVSKGRFFLSPGLAPTFQVYMASMFENQYKLLARSENKVQEVIVQTSLSKEEMKSAILTCTNRVE